MSIAADPTYRSIRLAFTNNNARGNELVQLYARILGGDWVLVRTFAVAGAEQVTSWDTALPVAFYDLAERYVNGNVPAVGYEGGPDDWTAPTAAGSKTTVTTSSADVAWVSGNFVDAATPINLQWTSLQLGVPYLLEKDVGAGFVTVAAGIVANNYAYTIPSGELGTTVTFRVTAQRDALVGPTAGTLDVPMFIVVGQPTWASATFDIPSRVAALVWNAASNATAYLLEKDPGSGWVTVGTVSATNYNYPVPDAEINTTVNFRVTGQNGAVSGTVSASQPLAMTIVVGTCVLSIGGAFNPVLGSIGFSWTAASNAAAYRLQADFGAGFVTIATTSSLGTTVRFEGGQLPLSAANTAVPFRVQPYNGASTGTVSNTVSPTFTVNLGADPGTPTITGYTGSGQNAVATMVWAAGSGDIFTGGIDSSTGGAFFSGQGTSWVGPGGTGGGEPATDPGAGTLHNYTTPISQIRIRNTYLGGAFTRVSGVVVPVWP